MHPGSRKLIQGAHSGILFSRSPTPCFHFEVDGGKLTSTSVDGLVPPIKGTVIGFLGVFKIQKSNHKIVQVLVRVGTELHHLVQDPYKALGAVVVSIIV